MEFSKCFVCGDCRICFNDKDGLLKHQRQEHRQVQQQHGNQQTMLELQVRLHRFDKNLLKKIKKNPKQQMELNGKGNKEAGRSNQCSICGSTLSSYAKLKAHIARVHEKRRPHKCQHCNKAFYDKHTRLDHERIHTGHLYKCEHCDKSFNFTSALTAHVGRIHKKELKHKCFCEKSFFQFRECEGHQRVHTDERPFNCALCNRAFKTQSALNGHKITHSAVEIRPFKCTYCTKCFARSNTKMEHDRTHTGQKPHQCKVCQKKFAKSSTLNAHLNSLHYKQKTHPCSYCSKSFCAANSRRYHEQTIHLEDPKAKQIHKCEHCNQEFRHKTSMQAHIKLIHLQLKPIKCQYCQMSFTNKSRCAYHERTHTGHKPYKCSYCSKVFRMFGTLNLHIRSHTKEKPYQCDHCEKLFRSSGEKNSHMKHIHHK